MRHWWMVQKAKVLHEYILAGVDPRQRKGEKVEVVTRTYRKNRGILVTPVLMYHAGEWGSM